MNRIVMYDWNFTRANQTFEQLAHDLLDVAPVPTLEEMERTFPKDEPAVRFRITVEQIDHKGEVV